MCVCVCVFLCVCVCVCVRMYKYRTNLRGPFSLLQRSTVYTLLKRLRLRNYKNIVAD